MEGAAEGALPVSGAEGAGLVAAGATTAGVSTEGNRDFFSIQIMKTEHVPRLTLETHSRIRTATLRS